jgi:hypothetical protein
LISSSSEVDTDDDEVSDTEEQDNFECLCWISSVEQQQLLESAGESGVFVGTDDWPSAVKFGS